MARSFFEDGSVRNTEIVWQDRGQFVRGHREYDQFLVELRWTQSETPAPAPLDWTTGTVAVSLSNASAAGRRGVLRGELWQQVIVDRNRSLRIHESDGMRMLLPVTEFMLAGGLLPLTLWARLGMSIDALVAWGSGAQVVTVYETVVQRRPIRRNVFPNNPDGRRRITASYDVDTVALARRAAQVRVDAEAWLATLGDFRSRCERDVEVREEDIVVT